MELLIGSLVGTAQKLGRLTLFLDLIHRQSGEIRKGFLTVGSIFSDHDQMVVAPTGSGYLPVGKIVFRKVQGLYDLAIVLLEQAFVDINKCQNVVYSQPWIETTPKLLSHWSFWTRTDGQAGIFSIYPRLIYPSELGQTVINAEGNRVPMQSIQTGNLRFSERNEDEWEEGCLETQESLIKSSVSKPSHNIPIPIAGALGWSPLTFYEVTGKKFVEMVPIPIGVAMYVENDRLFYRALRLSFNPQIKQESLFWDWEQMGPWNEPPPGTVSVFELPGSDYGY
jgi:hypothetical protein